jgi:hypothetical protein
MRRILGYVLYLLAIVITALVVADKYFGFNYAPIGPVMALVKSDHARSLLIALVLAFISKWF